MVVYAHILVKTKRSFQEKDVKKFLRWIAPRLTRQWDIYVLLKECVSEDCHSRLLWELWFAPAALEQRFATEMRYQTNKNSRWKF